MGPLLSWVFFLSITILATGLVVIALRPSYRETWEWADEDEDGDAAA